MRVYLESYTFLSINAPITPPTRGSADEIGAFPITPTHLYAGDKGVIETFTQ